MRISQPNLIEQWLDPLKLRILLQLQTEGILTERRLAKYVGVSHVTVSRILQLLERDRLASSKRVGRANLWSLNRECYGYLALEPILAVFEKARSPRRVLQDVLLEFLPKNKIQSATLFGSVVDGTERDDSDIDLGIILRPGIKADDPQFQKGIEGSVDRCYRLFGRRLAPYVLSDADWKRKRNTPLVRQIENGEKIYP